ncbi:MAG: hypothetical protein KF847_09310 [Pirellulales bacterium]|nr:hypothetical protein [Pirellulales bacterium]
MNRLLVRSLCAAVAALTLALGAIPAQAQCETCATPVAVAPVTVGYAPTVTYEPYTGWYPGKLFDQMRVRRWTRNATPTYTAAYAPAAYTTSYTPYVASYAPTSYTAAYAPAATAYTPYTASYAYTAAYAPYVTAYAPLQRTSYYAPAMLRPVAAMAPVVADGGCSACSACGSTCDACSGGVTQAVYADQYAAPSGGCASCAAGSGAPYYGGGSSDPYVGEQTPQPQLDRPQGGSQYDVNRPQSTTPPPDPAPAQEEDAAASYYPQLLKPANDRTASRPSADVWNAVYQRPARQDQVSTSAAATEAQPRERTSSELNADLWH